MAKLHELLAVDQSRKQQGEKVRGELMHTFEKKGHLFSARTESFKPFTEGAQPVVEKQLDLQTTVPKELTWISEYLVNTMDIGYAVAEANTAARGDVLLDDGTKLLEGIPATALLELEKRATEVRDLISKIPTLDPAKGFQPDADRGADVFRARDDVRNRTKKTQKALVLYPHTEKHPAQAQMITEDEAVGEIRTMEWSGLITSAAKGDMLARAENLIRAITRARSRANDIEVKESKKIGATLLKFIFG